ncbi:MAG TPA: energy transducer TonB [Gammaproteobacteria bacterium]
MRYLAGFITGFVVSVLLLIFQQQLIGAERQVRPEPGPVITLAPVPKSRPPETKPYEAKQPPPEPVVQEKPADPVSPIETQIVRPVLLSAPGMDAVMIHGDGPVVEWGGMPASHDGSAVVKLPVEPQYPHAALRDGIEGEVEVEFTVLPDGSVSDIRVVRADPPGVFDASARRAIQRWQFIPRRENGVAVSMRARQVIAFRLPARAD